MQQMKYQIKFLTPAFLGNAEQSGQWRTPPFKALLRQWWRVVWAQRHRFPEDSSAISAMRRDEGRLFGNAWLDGDFRKSAVRLRLSTWADGSATRSQWEHQQADRTSKIRHPEVKKPIGPLLYLGYGPLKVKEVRRQGHGKDFITILKSNAAIQAGETATLSITAPASSTDDIRAALALSNAYGTVGGRSRNGWGSLAIMPLDGSPSLDASVGTRQQGVHEPDCRFIRPLSAALKLDWPHAIGADDTGPLVWRTAESHDDWKALMRHLAILKIGLRTMFVFPDTRRPPHPEPLDRHWLAYPITRHGTSRWKRNARLPNSLRFKVRPDHNDPKRLRGVIFHAPCRPPADFGPNPAAIEKVWGTTHGLLDELTRPREQRRYEMIGDRRRRDELKPSLDTLTLERSPE